MTKKDCNRRFDFHDKSWGVIKIFGTSFSIWKTRIEQGCFWLDTDNNIADQYIRIEWWLFGFLKVRDTLKTMNNGIANSSSKRVGFGIQFEEEDAE